MAVHMAGDRGVPMEDARRFAGDFEDRRHDSTKSCVNVCSANDRRILPDSREKWRGGRRRNIGSGGIGRLGVPKVISVI